MKSLGSLSLSLLIGISSFAQDDPTLTLSMINNQYVGLNDGGFTYELVEAQAFSLLKEMAAGESVEILPFISRSAYQEKRAWFEENIPEVDWSLYFSLAAYNGVNTSAANQEQSINNIVVQPVDLDIIQRAFKRIDAIRNPEGFSNLDMQQAVNAQDLRVEIAKAIDKVEEFKVLKEWAAEKGIRFALTGLSAARFAHYVKAHMISRQERGSRFEDKRFDYSFESIFGRAPEPLHFIIDSIDTTKREVITASVRDDATAFIVKNYPKMLGGIAPEDYHVVSRLMHSVFVSSSTDIDNSYSSAALFFNPAQSRDFIYNVPVLEPDSEGFSFLKDVADHDFSARFNPSLSTINHNDNLVHLMKLIKIITEFDLKLTETQVSAIKNYVDVIDFSEIAPMPKAKAIEFGMMALRRAYSVERAWDLLEKVGLRGRIISLDGHRINEVGSASWWLNKEPLRSKPLGTIGKTAGELGLDIISHDTKTLDALDSITKPTNGDVNLFRSRSGVPGETAAFGDGVYMRVGVRGHLGTNKTIIYKIHPDAREGEDFIINSDLVTVLNAKAVKTIGYKEFVKERAETYLANTLELDKVIDAASNGNKDAISRVVSFLKYFHEYPKRFNELDENQRRLYRKALAVSAVQKGIENLVKSPYLKVLLPGPPGIGKTAIYNDLAELYLGSDQKPPSFEYDFSNLTMNPNYEQYGIYNKNDNLSSVLTDPIFTERFSEIKLAEPLLPEGMSMRDLVKLVESLGFDTPEGKVKAIKVVLDYFKVKSTSLSTPPAQPYIAFEDIMRVRNGEGSPKSPYEPGSLTCKQALSN